MDVLRLSDEFLNVSEQEQEVWRIKSDLEADWSLDRIREVEAERNRFKMVALAKIEQLQQAVKKVDEKCDREKEFFEFKLQEYFGTVKPKETKTQKVYNLPSGKLILKSQQPEYVRDEEVLVDWVEQNKPEHIKVKKSVDWASLKKTVNVTGNIVVDSATGEVINGVKVVAREPKFMVEVD